MTLTALGFGDSQFNQKPTQVESATRLNLYSPVVPPNVKVIVQDEQGMAIAQSMKFAMLPQAGDLIWVRGTPYICIATKREFFDHDECFYLAIVRPAKGNCLNEGMAKPKE